MRDKKATRDYLIGMGCETAFATFLSKRHPLSDLQGLSIEKLKELGLSAGIAEDINKRRPPIPPNILDEVLLKNLRICCVCYADKKSVILHHIKPYATEQKHEASNLATLCLQCHGMAHAKYETEQNLDEDRLFTHKKSWEAAVAHRKQWVLATSNGWSSQAQWEWINYRRLQSTLQELANEETADELPSSDQRTALEEAGFLEPNGYRFMNLADGLPGEGNYFTNIGKNQLNLTTYLSQLMDWLSGQKPIFDATEHCDNPAMLEKVLEAGLYLCAGVDFSTSGPDDRKIGRGRNAKVIFEFEFDELNCTTATSRSITWRDALSQLVVFGTVRSKTIDRHSGVLTVSVSPLGLAQTFNPNDYLQPGYFVANPDGQSSS